MDKFIIERTSAIRRLIRERQLAAVHLICLVLSLLMRRRLQQVNSIALPSRELALHRQQVRNELLNDLSLSGKCHEIIRMGKEAFCKLCDIRLKKRFHPYFKDCVGAIDGTHVRVKVRNKDIPRYRGRKGYPTINVLGVCTFDLKFTYILTGWEGTASDSRIVKDALVREDKLYIPHGKYYLVDGGLPHKSGLIAPFRGVRYHLKEYSFHPPENPKELFNLRHASLRNAIERAFGVLKRRFPIIRSTAEPFYSCETQSNIFLACCILHNFLMDEDRDKKIEEEVIEELLKATPGVESQAPREFNEDSAQAEALRNSIANAMWRDYLLHPDAEVNMSN